MDDDLLHGLLPNGSVPIAGGAPDDDPDPEPAFDPALAGVREASRVLEGLGWLESEAEGDPAGGEGGDAVAGGEGDPAGGGEGGEEQWTPPALIRPDRDWDGTFPIGPAEVYGEVTPFATYVLNEGTAEGLSRLPPDQLEAATRGAIEAARYESAQDTTERWQSEINRMSDLFLVELGQAFDDQGPEALREWSQQKPRLYNAYLQALSRSEAGEGQGQGQGQGQRQRQPGAANVRLTDEANEVYAAASTALRDLPDADRTRLGAA